MRRELDMARRVALLNETKGTEPRARDMTEEQLQQGAGPDKVVATPSKLGRKLRHSKRRF